MNYDLFYFSNRAIKATKDFSKKCDSTCNGNLHSDNVYIRGAQGIIGPDGERGDTGKQGPTGEVGQKGKRFLVDIECHIYIIDIGDNGDKGNLGEKGDKGFEGAQGIVGEQGIQGPIGNQVKYRPNCDQ